MNVLPFPDINTLINKEIDLETMSFQEIQNLHTKLKIQLKELAMKEEIRKMAFEINKLKGAAELNPPPKVKVP